MMMSDRLRDLLAAQDHLRTARALLYEAGAYTASTRRLAKSVGHVADKLTMEIVAERERLAQEDAWCSAQASEETDGCG